MKLLNCLECNDITLLYLGGIKTCLCGKSQGTYIDKSKVIYSGPARILGMDNKHYLDSLLPADLFEVNIPAFNYSWFVIPEGNNIRQVKKVIIPASKSEIKSEPKQPPPSNRSVEEILKDVSEILKRKKKKPRKNPKVIPYGECFAWAFRKQAELAKEDQNSTLIHARVTDPWDQHKFWHAWIEYKGRVYDWQTVVALSGSRGDGPNIRTISEFRKLWKPTKERKYTRLEAIKMLLKNQHLGPWHKR